MKRLALIIFLTLLTSPLLAATWTGNQTISGPQVYNNEIITCAGNITITEDGSLTLTNNSILEMDSSYDGEFTIRVENGGQLYILSGSKITAKDPTKRYNLIFEAESRGTIESSTIEYTYGDPDNPDTTGFIVSTDNFVIRDSVIQNAGSSGLVINNGASNFLIENTTIEGNVIGLVITEEASGQVINSNITSNESANIIIDNSDPIISGNTISSSEVGIIISNKANPNLGDLSNDNPNDDGGNVFLNNSIKDIENTTSNTIEMENNIWGTDDPAAISERVSGPVDLSPIRDLYPPSLTLLSLTSGGTLIGNASTEVRWSASDSEDSVDIPITLLYSINSGTSYTVIASLETNTGSYDWTVPNIATSNGRLKIEAQDNAHNFTTQESASDFTIVLAAQQFTFENGVRVSVPAGATSLVPTITVEALSTLPGTLPTNKRLISNVYTISSDVTSFASPISVTIPIENGHFGPYPFAWASSAWNCSGLAIATIESGTLTFNTSQLGTFAALANNLTVTTPLAAPNPFSPDTQSTKLIYWLDTAATTKLYIFDLTGNLIWQKEYISGETGAQANYNQVEWNGTSLFGHKVENGLYIFKVVSGRRCLGSGRIIALR
ncbi:hypothetical protein COT42_02890 [Candidatus Saganbacteria bacterium CG08_land_8_20_14_0_20_45_16]|uniref:Right handed beta helix domain-containing protein n=1 Tax=Candidatus Saganbacteria bacterium CG08_land_8_20_14_0_20_45_16 TaxID=2014293 RepID=A0A2H0XZH9_UNCSA|nr:MAG: hypothetical protein COT42_02890 [Candidatus Saganbacteria bacterium CG08_land_8_20_14_0_20_45_16]